MSDYTLYHADCLDILPTLAPGSVDAVICDPPYGTTACKWDSVIPFEPMWAGIKRVLKPRGACVLFGSQPFTSALVMSNVGWFRYEWIWIKSHSSGHLSSKQRPMQRHESIVVFSAEAHIYNPQLRKGTPKQSRVGRDHMSANTTTVYGASHNLANVITDYYYPTTDLHVACGARMHSHHPTQKPLALLEYLVKTYTNAGDTVLDFAFGSGTTGAACGNLDRRFVGIEKDAGYFAIAQERIATAYAPLRHMQQVAV